MEWVETTGPTVASAKELALDQLGVDEADAEFEVVQDAKRELFGFRRTDARVRARVRPTAPPPKRGRRRGREGGEEPGNGRRRAAGGARGEGRQRDASPDDRPRRRSGGEEHTGTGRRRRAGPGPEASERASTPVAARRGRTDGAEESAVSEASIGVMDQARMAEEFLLGLAERMGLEGAATSVQELDEELAEVRLDGEGAGLLVGRRGATLQALQELTKTVLQRRTPPDAEGRIRVDVAGYRERRRAALETFVRSIAEEVRATGEEQALEPMNAADRKVVHDTVNEIEGVATTSEGADPRRRVVIVPA